MSTEKFLELNELCTTRFLEVKFSKWLYHFEECIV